MSKGLSEPSRWLYYYRVSSQVQEKTGHGLERYEEQGLELGIPPDNLYSDTESGTSATREGFLAICERLQSDAGIEGLITPHHSRLHRSLEIWVPLRRLLLEKKLQLIDLSKGLEPIDLLSAEGGFIANMEAILAERHSAKVREDSTRGHANRRKKRRSMFAPFGYKVDRDTRKPVPNLDEYRPGLTFWDAAKQLVQWFIHEGNSQSATVKLAYEAWGDCDLHRSRPTIQHTFRGWIQNPALRGYFYNSLTEELTPNNHEALITEAEFKSIENRIKFQAHKQKRPHQLARLIFCADCGSIIFKLNCHGGKYTYLYCRGAKPYPGKAKICDNTDGQVYGDIELQVIEALTTKAQEIGTQVAEPDEYVPSPEAEKLRAQIKKYEALGDPDLEDVIEAKKLKLRTLLAQETGDDVKVDQEMLEFYQAEAADVDFWLEAEPEERAALYRELIDKVLVNGDGKVEVFFNF